MTVNEAEIKQNEFAKKFDILKAYTAKKPGYDELKKIFLKIQKFFVTDGKKLFMGLKMEYYHFLKRMVWKLIAVINNRYFRDTWIDKISWFFRAN